jgi:LmbE family N-acetylglucosaminyl deacetylase
MKVFITIFLLFSTSVFAFQEIQELPNFHSIVVFAPHPDDETLIAGGIIQTAVANHIPIKIVVITNGDILGHTYGSYRENETIRAMKLLGLKEEDVIFLGYGDKLMTKLLKATDPKEIFKSKAHREISYAHRGLCKKSYHECWTNEKAAYNQENVVLDINHILETYNPDGIFTTSRFDIHPDHSATQAFVMNAIIKRAELDNTFHPTLYEAIVHAPHQILWPYFNTGKIHMPNIFKSDPEVWSESFLRFKVPNRKLKLHAINKYLSQMYTPWLRDYAKEVEPFQAFQF